MKTDVIKLLPDSVANQIAAGEVIQRPASVVKELVENAVDAGATSIKIVLKDAGRTLIQVVDNGCGMSETDARLAFERHSTSKIRQAADLFELHTMGFRGEALASIAAVAQVDLRTKRTDDILGTRLIISGSKVESQEPEGCPAGSNMMVKNLFFNVPARRKFLKKDAVELSNIMHEFERLALVNPGIEFTIIHNDSTLHQLTPGNLKQRIGQLFGKTVEQQLLPVETSTSLVKINGFICRPDGARKRNSLQYFFVNGRNMLHPYFRKAILQCYESLINAESQPNYFINFEVDPATIDVNIHPTKNEIKFENEQPIWQILEASVRESLGKFNMAPAMDFSDEDFPEIPAFTPSSANRPDLGEVDLYNPFAPTSTKKSTSRPSALNTWRKESQSSFNDWDKLYNRWNSEEHQIPEQEPAHNQQEIFPPVSDIIPPDPATILLKQRYILTPTSSGLLIIDQYRAQVKIHYEDIIKILRSATIPTQALIFPEMFNLSTARQIYFDSIVDRLEGMGFDLSPLGNGTWSINGVPAIISDGNAVEILEEIVDKIEQNEVETDDRLVEKVALAMARSKAAKSNIEIKPEEMGKLVNELFALPTPTYTPDGNLILKIVETDALLKGF